MGMYDEVTFKCPVCGRFTTDQSKAGPCGLEKYSIKNAPLTILADLAEDSKEGRLYCQHCHTKLEVQILFKVQVREYGSPVTDNWRTT